MNRNSEGSSESQDELLEGFEERADHINEEVLRNGTVIGDYFDRVHDALVARGLVLVQGPRGCGKTHMMRYSGFFVGKGARCR